MFARHRLSQRSPLLSIGLMAAMSVGGGLVGAEISVIPCFERMLQLPRNSALKRSLLEEYVNA